MNPDLKANRLLKYNIDELLHRRHQSRKDLAQWCHKSESWISKIFREDRREFAVSALDRIADFFGLATYQLFQPGISSVTERRKGERRVSRERRIGTTGRLASQLQSEVNKFPRFARQADYDPRTLPAEIRAIMERADRDIAAVEAKITRRQVAGARGKVAGASQSRRGVRGPDPETD